MPKLLLLLQAGLYGSLFLPAPPFRFRIDINDFQRRSKRWFFELGYATVIRCFEDIFYGTIGKCRWLRIYQLRSSIVKEKILDLHIFACRTMRGHDENCHSFLKRKVSGAEHRFIIPLCRFHRRIARDWEDIAPLRALEGACSAPSSGEKHRAAESW